MALDGAPEGAWVLGGCEGARWCTMAGEDALGHGKGAGWCACGCWEGVRVRYGMLEGTGRR